MRDRTNHVGWRWQRKRAGQATEPPPALLAQPTTEVEIHGALRGHASPDGRGRCSTKQEACVAAPRRTMGGRGRSPAQPQPRTAAAPRSRSPAQLRDGLGSPFLSERGFRPDWRAGTTAGGRRGGQPSHHGRATGNTADGAGLQSRGAPKEPATAALASASGRGGGGSPARAQKNATTTVTLSTEPAAS